MLATASLDASVQAAAVEKLPTCVTEAGVPGTNINSNSQYVMARRAFAYVPPRLQPAPRLKAI
jgi:hypothetical protein